MLPLIPRGTGRKLMNGSLLRSVILNVIVGSIALGIFLVLFSSVPAQAQTNPIGCGTGGSEPAPAPEPEPEQEQTVPEQTEPEQTEENEPEETQGTESQEQPCGETLTEAGCCTNNVLTWCEDGQVETLSCKTTCGWSNGAQFYNCGQDPVAEPSGANPYGCDGSDAPIIGAGATEEENPGQSSTDPLCEAAGLPVEGCCEGSALTYCENGVLITEKCAVSCGWDASIEAYDCDLAAIEDPSGQFPMLCTDAGIVTDVDGINGSGQIADQPEEDEDANEFAPGSLDSDEENGGEVVASEEPEDANSLPTGTTTAKEQEGEEAETDTELPTTSEDVGTADNEEASIESGGIPSPTPSFNNWNPTTATDIVDDPIDSGLASEGGCSTGGNGGGGMALSLIFAMLALGYIPEFRRLKALRNSSQKS